jgi:6-phosphofructo-2-kinase/fructose-2,6-biphosphatase
MGTSGSKSIDGVGAVSGVGAAAAGLGGAGGEGGAAEAWHGGAQLYVSLKMENAEISGDLVPHVYGSEPIIGTWDPSRAVRTHRTATPPDACALCSASGA